MTKVKNSNDEAGPLRVGTAQLVNASQGRSDNWEEGSIFFTASINGKEVRVIVDIGATHNFVVDRVVQMLGLDLKKNNSWVKTVIAEAVQVKGVTSTKIRIGSLQGQCDLMVFLLDDFDPILGNAFFISAKVMVLSL